jgi:uncharacterized protein (TIGR02118 family)
VIKVSVMYPDGPGARFDHEYYRNKHMPLIKRRMGAALRYYTVDKGLSGGTPKTLPTYVGMCHLLCDSLESYHAAFDPHAEELFGDLRHFTDQTPVVQISEVIIENSSKS